MIPRSSSNWLLLELTVAAMLIACSESAPEPRDVLELSDEGHEADELELPPLTPGLCRQDGDCAPLGTCDFGFCRRSGEPTMWQCTYIWGEPTDLACVIDPLRGTVLSYDPECSSDADCVGSVFGAHCVWHACSVLRKCSEDGTCPGATQQCIDYNVCVPYQAGD